MINMLLGESIEDIESGDSGTEGVIKNLKESLGEAKNAASIIGQFRKYASAPSLDVTGPVDIKGIAEKISYALYEQAERAKVRIITKAMESVPKIEGNEAAIEQIFFILIQNAIEAADGKRRHNITISAKSIDKKLELKFADDCCGIAPGDLEKIFEPFFTTKLDKKGMGLGLEIAQRILVACGGEIRVESELGKGATFYVTLPAAQV
jgi:signal transduction histidine kinase